MLPEWQYFDHPRNHHIDLDKVQYWRESISLLPEGFHSRPPPVFHEASKEQVFLYLLIASAIDSRRLIYELLEMIKVLVTGPSQGYTAGNIGTSVHLRHCALLYGLAMVLIIKIKHAVALGEQLTLLDALTVFRAYGLAASIRAPSQLREELLGVMLLVKPLLTDTCQAQSLVLRAMHVEVYEPEIHDIHFEVGYQFDVEYLLSIDLHREVFLYGDALGFVCITEGVYDQPETYLCWGELFS